MTDTPNKLSSTVKADLAQIVAGTELIFGAATIGKTKRTFQTHLTATDKRDSTVTLMVTDGVTPVVMELALLSKARDQIDPADVEIRSWQIETPSKARKARKALINGLIDLGFDIDKIYSVAGSNEPLSLAVIDNLGISITTFLNNVQPDELPTGHMAFDQAEDLMPAFRDTIAIDDGTIGLLSGKVVDIISGQQTDGQIDDSDEVTQKTGTNG